MSYEYRQDQELPGITGEWLDANGDLIDFSNGWTFTAKIAAKDAPNTVLVSKATGITGAATSPNFSIDFSNTDFSTLAPAPGGTDYVVHFYARRNSDSKDRVFRPGDPIKIRLYPAPA